MTYTHQHTKARPSRWVAGYIVGYEFRKSHRTPIWSDFDSEVIVTNAMFEAVKVVALALDKMTK